MLFVPSCHISQSFVLNSTEIYQWLESHLNDELEVDPMALFILWLLSLAPIIITFMVSPRVKAHPPKIAFPMAVKMISDDSLERRISSPDFGRITVRAKRKLIGPLPK